MSDADLIIVIHRIKYNRKTTRRFPTLEQLEAWSKFLEDGLRKLKATSH